jgi:hypothetical protein
VRRRETLPAPLQHCQVRFLTLEDRLGVPDVLLAHSFEEVEPLGIERRNRRERRHRHDAVRKQRRRRERVRPSAGDPPDAHALEAERVADRCDVLCAACDIAAQVACRAAEARAVVGKETDPLRLRVAEMRLVQQVRAGGAVEDEYRDSCGETALAHGERAPVHGRNRVHRRSLEFDSHEGRRPEGDRPGRAEGRARA